MIEWNFTLGFLLGMCAGITFAIALIKLTIEVLKP